MTRPSARSAGRAKPAVAKPAAAKAAAAQRPAVAGHDDGLDRLWTPHRMAYVTGADKPAEGYEQPTGCPFCRAPHASDEDGLVIARGERVFALLNLYPYNPGHL